MIPSNVTAERCQFRRRFRLLLLCLCTGLNMGCGAIPAVPSATPTPTTPPGMTQARVVSVVDGDTIRVSISGQVFTLRYIGMNTPERDQPYYDEATAQNAALVSGKTVFLEKDVSETDRYGRLLRYVHADGIFVNAELVRLGYAQAGTYPPDIKYNHLFFQLEREARQGNRGLWCLPPTPTTTPRSEGTPAPLSIVGQVERELSLHLEAQSIVKPVTLTTEHPQKGMQTYLGWRLNDLLTMAGTHPSASSIVLIAANGYRTEIGLTALIPCRDCLVTATGEGLETVMPGMASRLWVRGLVRIEVN